MACAPELIGFSNAFLMRFLHFLLYTGYSRLREAGGGQIGAGRRGAAEDRTPLCSLCSLSLT
jgi:hypothetical protein